MISKKIYKIVLFFLFTVCYAMISFNVKISADDKVSTAWRIPTKPPISLSVSNGGHFFGTVDKSGEVRLYGVNGNIVWKTTVADATDMLIARNGQSVIVYSNRNPENTYVHFFNSVGTRLWKHKVQGSIWAGAVSSNGNYAAITTAKGFVYLYNPDPGRYKYRRWRMDGIGNSIEFSPDSNKVYVGTWEKSMLVAYDINGKFLWRSRLNTEKQYNVQVSSDGKTILTMLSPSKSNESTEIALWNTGGSLIWRRYIEGFNSTSLVSSKSRFVAIGYLRLISPDTSDISERKIAVYDSKGRLSWEKGGLFFSPHLAALPPNGESVIVTDGLKSIYRVNDRGKILSRLTLRGTIRLILTSNDGSKILLYCGDGWLYLLDVR